MQRIFATGQAPSFNTRTYVLPPPVARPPRRLLQCARRGTQLKKIGVVGNGITRALAVAIRKKTQTSCLYRRPSYASLCEEYKSYSVNVLTQCFHATPFFLGTDLRPPNKITDTPACMPSLIFHSLPRPASSSTTSAVICHGLASRSDQNNAFGERILFQQH